MKSTNFKRGFTLIELMIVIVILGILMGTILPRLTGAQSRARDTARTADLNNIAQALEVYFNDFGSYPDADPGNCLDPASTGTSADALGDYLKGGAVPSPASDAQDTAGCVGMYYYIPLPKDGVPSAGYVLATDVETFQSANFILGRTGAAAASKIEAPATADYSAVALEIDNGDFKAADDLNASSTILVVIP